MDNIKLGNTGMDISPLALGCMTYGDPARGPHPWTLPESESRPLIRPEEKSELENPYVPHEIAGY